MNVGEIQDEKLNDTLAQLEKFERRLYEKVVAYLATISLNGQLNPTNAQLAVIRDQITGWYRELGYGKIIESYIAALDDIDDLNRAYYASQVGSRERIRIEREIIKSPVTQEYRRQVAESLRGFGAAEALIKPIEDVLRIDAIRGITVEQAATELRNRITSDSGRGITQAHIETVAVDALRMYDGLIQEELFKVFKPTKGRYFGSVIETSRPFCDHMKDKFANRIIEVSELKVVLDEYAPNGEPSKDKITYETVNGVTATKAKGSGMYPNTTIDTFFMNVGGHRCRHEWKWVF
jgi:hypothetical protein